MAVGGYGNGFQYFICKETILESENLSNVNHLQMKRSVYMSIAKDILKNIHYNFWKLHSNFLKKNSKLRNLHQGETCLILGNGGSLRYLDFSKLKGIPTIGCTYSLLDRRAMQLDLKYMVFTDPYELMPVRYNRLTKTFQTKFYAPLFKSQIKEYRHITFFSSLTNVYAHFFRPGNLFYFNYRPKKSMDHDISGDFSYTDNALHIMIGVAKYLGFKKVILLGCDYLGEPKLEGHFYAYRKPAVGETDLPFCEKAKKITEGLDVIFVSLKGIQSPVFESAPFSEYFGGQENYLENTDIVDEKYLRLLRRGADKKQVYL